MIKYILKDKKSGNFLHFEFGSIVQWHNINPEALCAFDTYEEAKDIIDDMEIDDAYISKESFTETFFDNK